VARDRQRAKRRRAERRASGGDAGQRPGAPGPLDHSSADVDEALLAEAGGVSPETDPEAEGEELGVGIYPDELGDDDRPDRAEDAVEGDAVSRHELEREAHGPRRKRGRVFTFLGHCVDELRRVQWPNRRQVGQATAVVLGFVVIAGGYLGLLDALWKPLIEAIL
jgi:preprotein translocase subunit SecE